MGLSLKKTNICVCFKVTLNYKKIKRYENDENGSWHLMMYIKPALTYGSCSTIGVAAHLGRVHLFICRRLRVFFSICFLGIWEKWKFWKLFMRRTREKHIRVIIKIETLLILCLHLNKIVRRWRKLLLRRCRFVKRMVLPILKLCHDN